MVQTAVADIIGPAVAAYCPDGFLYKIVLSGQDAVDVCLQGFVFDGSQLLNGFQKLSALCLGDFSLVSHFQPFIDGFF